MQHPAWRELSGNTIKLVCVMLAMYRPNKPNSFGAGANRVAAMIGVSEKTAKRAVDEAIATGHFREERKGRNIGRVQSRERIISLTRHDTETHAGDVEWPIKVWEKAKRTQKNVPDEHGKSAGFEKGDSKRISNNGGADVIPLKKADTRM